MLKSCKYCGMIHDRKMMCSKKTTRIKIETKANKFRNTSRWQKKREEIKERDNYICQICFRNLYNTKKKINYESIEVHHIVPIEDDETLALENENLISLCTHHHKLADANKIPRGLLMGIAKENRK